MLHKILIFFIFTIALQAKLNIIVSILPQKELVQKIVKDKANVTVMVLPKNSPHTYEPKPYQMIQISKANLYFSIGVEFEKVWLEKFANQNKKMKIIDISKNIKRIDISNTKSKRKDPHIWTSIKNLKILSKNILEALIKYDKKNKDYYQKNYKLFISQLNNLDKKIKKILSNSKNAKFMVFHPSWGYFAKEYNLVQLPIELEGKNPKPKEFLHLIKIAKKYKIKAIFTSPEFSDILAKQMANELNIKVLKISPLTQNIEQTLLKLAKAIANN